MDTHLGRRNKATTIFQIARGISDPDALRRSSDLGAPEESRTSSSQHEPSPAVGPYSECAYAQIRSVLGDVAVLMKPRQPAGSSPLTQSPRWRSCPKLAPRRYLESAAFPKDREMARGL